MAVTSIRRDALSERWLGLWQAETSLKFSSFLYAGVYKRKLSVTSSSLQVCHRIETYITVSSPILLIMAGNSSHSSHSFSDEGEVGYNMPGHMSTSEYIKTRFSTLKPTITKTANPFKLLAMLTLQQWLFFGVAFFAWTWDAFDFFTVSLTVTDLAETFKKTNTDITWGITLVLMFRSIGSTLFGFAADRYGRKWYVYNS